MEIKELKQQYEILQKKHNLPPFDDLNSTFDIGKIERDSGNLMRDVRRAMIEKVSHYLRLMELMLNPSQASPIFLILLKEITADDKRLLDAVFSSFIELEIASYSLDVKSSDSDESIFILKIYSVWNQQREQLIKLLGILERNWKQAAGSHKRIRDYFN